ncbi:MBL fold metallo-hydrolase [Streptomyces sp. G-G2]|uniref:MBL fold metallo-hydrolase n=1 Tax=Streptomyces sp. G-G2 TaxID=3046201 RepID=UPI0024BA8656|nr:MBL fold metallo-hydrolase [Streptomyces sp. G-G2]MDJ0380122.1 MBL fold metallo-hydrolase [Streptomyces sp. G-G2]
MTDDTTGDTTDFSLQILGASCAVPNPDQATSAYLLRARGTAVLLECGHGAVGKLLKYGSPEELTAIVVSHMHPDHFFDLVALRNYVFCHGLPKLPLFLPANGSEILRGVAGGMHLAEDYFDAAFTTHAYGEKLPFTIGALAFEPVTAVHNTVANALRITDDAGRTLVFSSDTAHFEGLVRLADHCDLLLIEATSVTAPASGEHWHMTPAQAADIARRAEPRRTLLTHYDARHAAASLAAATAAAPAADLGLATEGDIHVIGA